LIFSTQENAAINYVKKELQKANSKIRFVFATSFVGMGFDSPYITHYDTCQEYDGLCATCMLVKQEELVNHHSQCSTSIKVTFWPMSTPKPRYEFFTDGQIVICDSTMELQQNLPKYLHAQFREPVMQYINV